MSANQTRQLSDTTPSNAGAYAMACSVLFRLWAQHVKTFPDAARLIRAQLAALHCGYSSEQACPDYVCDHVIGRAHAILDRAYKARRAADPVGSMQHMQAECLHTPAIPANPTQRGQAAGV
jgi:hypothetical protein